MKLVLIVVGVLVSFPPMTHAQFRETASSPVPKVKMDSGKYDWWLDVGLGLGSWRGDVAVATTLSFSGQRGNSVLTFRYNRIFDLRFSGPVGEMSDYGFMYGRIAKSKYTYASVSGGIGVTLENTVHLGFPLEADLFATPIPWVGIGVKACADLSPGPGPTRNYWSVSLGLEIGRLR